MVKRWVVSLLLALLAVCSDAGAQRPVKLQVDLVTKSVRVGERARLIVRLVDADNRAVAAPKDLAVSIVARLPSNATEDLASAVLKAGQSEMQVELPPAKTEGWLYIWAKQPELRLGGDFLRIHAKDAARPAAQKPAAARPSDVMAAPPAARGAKPQVLTRIPIAGMAVAKRAGEPTPPPPPLPAAVGADYLLTLRYSPQRPFLANGKDPATVHAFVMARRDSPLPGFRLRLFDTSGTLNPAPLVIPPGEEEGVARLTSNFAGDVKVEYLGSTPRVDLDGEKVLAVRFEPPITGLELKPSPQRISLVDAGDVVVSLVDEKGTPIATRARRLISLTMGSGRGELSTKEIAIDIDNSIGRATFTPVWWGPVTLAASTPNLMSVEARLDVDPPLALLGISIAGGLVGGYVFMLKRRRTKRWRVPLGALTGVILFWAILFLGLSALPRTTILNPISIFVTSVLGGWLGTGVFDPILKRLGLGTP
jgi:hypothetical protein